MMSTKVTTGLREIYPLLNNEVPSFPVVLLNAKQYQPQLARSMDL
jgi:hypothetical protein